MQDLTPCPSAEAKAALAEFSQSLDRGASSAANAATVSKLNSQLIAEEVASGHAFEKHVIQGGEFKNLGIETTQQLNVFVEKIINNPATPKRYAVDGTTYCLDEASKTIVIRGTRGEATAFRPDYGGVGWDVYLKTQVPKKP